MQRATPSLFITMIDKLTIIAGKFSAQRHLTAVRESFITLMPIIIAASFFVLINNVILNQNGLVGWLALTGDWIVACQKIGIRVYNGTLNILSLMATVMIAYKLAKSYKEDAII